MFPHDPVDCETYWLVSFYLFTVGAVVHEISDDSSHLQGDPCTFQRFYTCISKDKNVQLYLLLQECWIKQFKVLLGINELTIATFMVNRKCFTKSPVMMINKYYKIRPCIKNAYSPKIIKTILLRKKKRDVQLMAILRKILCID